MFDALPPKLWTPPKPAIIRAASLDDINRAMPLLGTFGAASVRGFRSLGASVARRSYIGRTVDTSNQTTYSFTSVYIGTAAADRINVVCVGSAAAAGRSMSAAAIAGGSASIIKDATNAGINTSIIAAAVPTGTTATISVTYSAGCSGCFIDVYAMYGASITPTATASTTATPPSASLNIDARGVAFGCSGNNANNDCTWTGLAEDADAVYDSPFRGTSASAEFATAQTGLTITADWATESFPCMVLASFPPA